jgi:hypothetical protein
MTRDGGGLIEVTDERALAAWDECGRQTTGKAYPRNRRGGWHFPTPVAAGYGAEIIAAPIGRKA